MRRIVVFAMLPALLLAACSGGGTVVAAVNGVEITLDEVEGLRQDSSAAPRDQFNQDLFQLIVEEAVRQAADDQFSLVADPAAIEAEFEVLMAGIDLDQFGITEEAVRHGAFQQVLLPEIQARLVEQAGPVTDEDIQAAYEESVSAVATVCSRHILVGSEEEAEAVVQRLAEGEDFGELALELSIDTGSGAAGGDLGCATPNQYVPTFANATLEAEVGEVAGPVQSEFGFHVLIVDSREVPPLDDVRADLESSLVSERSSGLFNEWILAVLGSAEVVVTERYGTWQTEPTFGVAAPA